MNWGRSIRSRLILLILLVSVGALVIGMLSIGINYYQTSKQILVSEAEDRAIMLSRHMVNKVLTMDEREIQIALDELNHKKEFSAAVFDSTGNILARHEISDPGFYISESDFKDYQQTYWVGKTLHIWMPIKFEQQSEILGSLYMIVSTSDFYDQLFSFISISLLILVILVVLIYLIALRLQKTIAGPIVELEKISRKVSDSGDYTIRVPFYREDEIGSLAGSFNQMLATIELKQKERDAANEALQLNKKRLERAVKDLQYLANYDSLTRLPNRALCMDRIKYALKKSSRTNTMTALLFLDLDHFKDVNDSLGHAVGDQLLKATSKRLLSSVRSDDTLARLGGDEFVIILTELEKVDDVINIVEKIVASFEEPFKLVNYEVNTTVSIGVCIYPKDGKDVNSLMKAADSAMYKAKEDGRNTYEFYEAELNQLANRRHQLANELCNAIKNNELELFFQPQLNILENQIIGSEVLLRWYHPILGNISPAEFIPIAESTGLIRDIGSWVLDNACRKIAECRKNGIDMRLAVNLSAAQFRQIDLPEQIAQIMQCHRIPPRLLELEITESMLMRDFNQAIEILERLKEMQIRIAVDDFGTGYSSLSYLRRFPLDALKIDRSFIDELVVDSDDTAITLAIISMARSLRLEVIAEGVETAQQYDFLAKNACDDIQGYHVSRPLSYDAFIGFLKNHAAGQVKVD